MVLFAVREMVDLAIMTVLLGFIFMSYVRRPLQEYGKGYAGFSVDDFLFAVLVTAPGIILHELAHKFVALLFGLTATFKAWYFGLMLGVVLKLVQSPLIIFAPGYVEISSGSDAVQALVAFAGPFLNLVLYVVARIVLKRKKHLTRSHFFVWHATKSINGFLFVFNLLPIPPLDGSKVFFHLYRAIF